MEEGEDERFFLSLKDLEERGIKIDPNWNGLEALATVAFLASEKLEEENIRKKREEKERKSVRSNGYWSKSVVCNGYEGGNSSRSCDNRVSGRREIEKILVTNSVSDLRFEEKQGFKVATRDNLLCDAMKSIIMAREDDYDQGWRAEYTKRKQTLKRSSASRRDDGEEKDPKSKGKVKRVKYIVSEVTPDLPNEYREKIEELNGSNINLVIQKNLFTSDVSDQQSRLLIPWKQIFSIEKFLNPDERTCLDKENGELKSVNLFGPSLEEYKMSLKKRTMKKENGESTLSYVLIKDWKKFKNDNGLQKDNIIQLWSFRTPADELFLALVVVGKGGKIGGENNQNNNGDGSIPGSEVMGSNTGQAGDGSNPGSEVMGSNAGQAGDGSNRGSESHGIKH